jgi:HEAT repeat protein
LRELLAEDPAPSVRAAAAVRLVAVEGDAAMPALLRALDDPEPLVRNTAARAVASRGQPGIDALREVVLDAAVSGDAEPAANASAGHAALGGLSAAGRMGRKVVIEIARDHPDESMRHLAKLALGSGDDPH